MADPTHQFVVSPIIPFEFNGVDLSFTNASLWMVIGGLVSIALFALGSQKKAMVPGRMQSFAEIFYEFTASMIRENTGPGGRAYFPLIFTIFIMVIMGNVLGLIPYSFTYTSHIVVTFALAMVIFLAVTIFGLLNNGLKFFTLFAPPGVPLFLQFLIVPIEIISFLIRPVTLAMRLFANMVAGHMVMKVFAGFGPILLGLGIGGAIGSTLPVFFNVAVYALELLVALLQAYVFAILSSIYLKDTLDLHH